MRKDVIATVFFIAAVMGPVVFLNWSTWFPEPQVPVSSPAKGEPASLRRCQPPTPDSGGYIEAQPVECGVQTFEVKGVMQFYTWIDKQEEQPCRVHVVLPSGGSVFFNASLDACRVEWYRRYPEIPQ